MGGHPNFFENLAEFLSLTLGNPYVGALLVPFGFFVLGAFGKKLVRDAPEGSPFFFLSDWYLAPDAALTSLGVGLAECIERGAKYDPVSHHGEIRATLVFVGFAFFAYVIVLSVHKHYEPPKIAVWKKVWWLLTFANLLAFTSLFVFVLAFKGVGHA